MFYISKENIEKGVIFIAEVLTTSLNTRTSPGRRSPKVTTHPKYLYKGQIFYVYEMEGEWAKTIHPVTYEYIWVYTGSNYVKLTPIDQVIIIDSSKKDTENKKSPMLEKT